MSTESVTAWPVLNTRERRVLGVLVEKQKTTDTYPLTLNSLVTGCNQKSNRDPILDLLDEEIEETLSGLQKRGLVMRVISGRVDKWKHLLYEGWKLNGVEIAIVSELLLRGPQTEGELRVRASRMEDIADLDTLRKVLASLCERGLVVYLTPEGRRGTVVTHGFHDPNELARLRQNQPALPSEESASPPRGPETSVLASLQTELRDARLQIDQLQRRFNDLNNLVEQIRRELGINPSTPP